MKSELL